MGRPTTKHAASASSNVAVGMGQRGFARPSDLDKAELIVVESFVDDVDHTSIGLRRHEDPAVVLSTEVTGPHRARSLPLPVTSPRHPVQDDRF